MPTWQLFIDYLQRFQLFETSWVVINTLTIKIISYTDFYCINPRNIDRVQRDLWYPRRLWRSWKVKPASTRFDGSLFSILMAHFTNTYANYVNSSIVLESFTYTYNLVILLGPSRTNCHHQPTGVWWSNKADRFLGQYLTWHFMPSKRTFAIIGIIQDNRSICLHIAWFVDHTHSILQNI